MNKFILLTLFLLCSIISFSQNKIFDIKFTQIGVLNNKNDEIYTIYDLNNIHIGYLKITNNIGQLQVVGRSSGGFGGQRDIVLPGNGGLNYELYNTNSILVGRGTNNSTNRYSWVEIRNLQNQVIYYIK